MSASSCGRTVVCNAVTHVDEAAAAPGHPEAPPSGPPLTFDDLLDLHFLLDSDHWFDRILSPSGGVLTT